jgi:hypothetical protein
MLSTRLRALVNYSLSISLAIFCCAATAQRTAAQGTEKATSVDKNEDVNLDTHSPVGTIRR